MLKVRFRGSKNTKQMWASTEENSKKVLDAIARLYPSFVYEIKGSALWFNTFSEKDGKKLQKDIVRNWNKVKDLAGEIEDIEPVKELPVTKPLISIEEIENLYPEYKGKLKILGTNKIGYMLVYFPVIQGSRNGKIFYKPVSIKLFTSEDHKGKEVWTYGVDGKKVGKRVKESLVTKYLHSYLVA